MPRPMMILPGERHLGQRVSPKIVFSGTYNSGDFGVLF
jgi:hypothetical protein